MNVVDSSGWLEFLADGPNAGFFAQAIDATDELIVPTLSLYEVFKRLLLQRGEGAALQGVALMEQGRIVDLDASLALEAAGVSAQERLSMADAVILATARRHGATLWTQDADFQGMATVKYAARRRAEDDD